MSLASPALSKSGLALPAARADRPRAAVTPQQRKAGLYLLIFSVMLGCWLAGELLAWGGWIASPLGHALQGVRLASFYFVMMFACLSFIHLGTRPPRAEWRTLSVLGPATTFAVLILESVTQLGLTLADATCV